MSSYPKSLIQAYLADDTITQYTFVKFDDTDKKVIPAGDGEKFIGVAMTAATAGDDVEVAINGGALVKLSDTITRGESVCADANGEGDGGASTNWACTALQSGVDDDVIAVLLDGHYHA